MSSRLALDEMFHRRLEAHPNSRITRCRLHGVELGLQHKKRLTRKGRATHLCVAKPSASARFSSGCVCVPTHAPLARGPCGFAPAFSPSLQHRRVLSVERPCHSNPREDPPASHKSAPCRFSTPPRIWRDSLQPTSNSARLGATDIVYREFESAHVRLKTAVQHLVKRFLCSPSSTT